MNGDDCICVFEVYFATVISLFLEFSWGQDIPSILKCSICRYWFNLLQFRIILIFVVTWIVKKLDRNVVGCVEDFSMIFVLLKFSRVSIFLQIVAGISSPLPIVAIGMLWCFSKCEGILKNYWVVRIENGQWVNNNLYFLM